MPSNASHLVAYVLAWGGAILTTTYSARMMMISMLSRPMMGSSILIRSISDLPMWPLIVLALGGVLGGYLTQDWFVAVRTLSLCSLPLISVLLAFALVPSSPHVFWFSISTISFRYWDRALLEFMGPLGVVRVSHLLGFLLDLWALPALPVFTCSLAIVLITMVHFSFDFRVRSIGYTRPESAQSKMVRCSTTPHPQMISYSIELAGNSIGKKEGSNVVWCS